MNDEPISAHADLNVQYRRPLKEAVWLNRIGKIAGAILAGIVRGLSFLLIVPMVSRFAVGHTRANLGVTVKYGTGLLWCETPNILMRRIVFPHKETDILAWIERMEPGSVLWDIGAHVGFVTLPAALCGVRVLAFEPMPANFANLCENIRINRLGDLVQAFCIAFYRETRISKFKLSGTGSGTSRNTIDNEKGKQPDAGFVYDQAVLSLTCDSFLEIFDAPVPTYLKLDVDGNEIDILKGATRVLSNPALKEIFIEIDAGDPERRADIHSRLSAFGFSLAETSLHGRYGNAHYTRA